MSLPDFMIIGAMKCGTSTLQAQLAAQQGVFMTTPKEPNFFSDDAEYAKGLDWYRGLYDAADAHALRGEASTHYTKLPTYPHTLPRMTQVLESQKLIYMIRNPITRAISHYIHEWTEARMGHDPIAAFQTAPELIDYGRYAYQITPYIEAFGSEHIHLTSLEQLKADPQGELSRIGAFLDLPHQAIWNDEIGAQNVSAARVRKFPLQGLLIDNPVAQTLRRVLVPKALRTRIREARTYGERPELPDTLLRDMENRFAADHDELAALFPDHPALTLCYPFLQK